MANAKSNCFGLCDFRITHTLATTIFKKIDPLSVVKQMTDFFY